MRTLKSTGNAEQDAKLIADALKAQDASTSNNDTFEDAKRRSALSFSGKEAGNTLVSEPYQAGETLMVLPDEKPVPAGAKVEDKPDTAKVASTQPAATEQKELKKFTSNLVTNEK
jgi:hypothetical protein